jgi:hypothetical protein
MNPEYLTAGYCSDTDRATAVREFMSSVDMAPEKYSIRDVLNDDRIRVRFTRHEARKRRKCVVIRSDGTAEAFESGERSRFYEFAWNAVKNGAYNCRWERPENAEILFLTYDFIDTEL